MPLPPIWEPGGHMSLALKTKYFFEDLEIGMESSFAKTVSEADIVAFADVTGDHNPVHLDEDYASQTIFKTRIAHGMLTAGTISAVCGMQLPGPGAVYVSQTLNFRGPVKIGDRVVATVKIAELIPEKRRVSLDCACTVEGKVVLEGQAVLMVPRRSKAVA